MNRQITRNVNGAITFHVWDGWNLIEERDTGNAIQNIYLYAGDQIIENVTTKRFFFQDSLGNTSHVSDEAGNLLERYTYSAFGMPTFYNSAGNQIIVSGKNVSALGIRHLFQGQLWTQETGLNDYRNRVELPTMGVFLQPDPIGFKGDAANLYRFCSNNAVNRTDPLGLYVYSLTSWGGGDWSARADGITNHDVHLLNQAKIDEEIKAFEKTMNERPGDAKVRWSGRVNEIHDKNHKFGHGVVATTDWAVNSKANSDGTLKGFHNQLQINIYWNDSANARSQLIARTMTSPRGEFAHARDAFFYAAHGGHRKDRSKFQSARDVASGVANRLVGTKTPADVAERQMEDALLPWRNDSRDASKRAHDWPWSMDHVY